MKKIFLSLIAVAIVSATSMAQEKQKPMKSPEDRADRQIARMDKELTLTADQKTKMKEILVKRDQAHEDLNKKYPEKNDAYQQENRKLNAESEKEMKAVLTPEQIEKQKQMKEEQKEKRKQQQSATPPPSQTPAPASDPKK